MKTKICSKCKNKKPLYEFYKDIQKKDNLSSACKQCKNKQLNKYSLLHKKEKSIYDKNYRKINFFRRLLQKIKRRCFNPKCKNYKYYGGRGIECRITEDELKELWDRDKAYELKQPSIDRIDNDGHYEYRNCQFIEMVENFVKDKRKPILQYDLEGNFIREWKSIQKASQKLQLHATLIVKCCKKSLNKTGGFIWKYKHKK